MKHLVWLGPLLFLTGCGPDTTALDVGSDAGSGTGGSVGSTGGAGGGPSRGRQDGSIIDPGTGGTGGTMSTGGTSGSGGSTGGTGGTPVPHDAGPPDAAKKDALPSSDADVLCTETCPGFMQAYDQAIKQEQLCNPGVPSQCLKQTQGSLVCGCPVWVNTTVLSDAVRKNFLDAGCSRCIRFTACPAVACVNPGVGTCQPVSAAADPVQRPIAPPEPQGRCMAK